MCVYIIKKVCIYIYVCVCVCVYEGCLDKYISVATWPPKQKFLAPPLLHNYGNLTKEQEVKNNYLLFIFKGQ